MTSATSLGVLLVLAASCGSAAPPAEPTTASGPKPAPEAPKEYRHSPILNQIMKNEVNKPFSKLTFFVFHSDGDFDFAEIEKTTAEFHAGIAKARAFPDPPVESEQGREVFATFLEHLDRDCNQLSTAITQRDGRKMRQMLGKLSRTCNNCHHFFRLDIADSPEK